MQHQPEDLKYECGLAMDSPSFQNSLPIQLGDHLDVVAKSTEHGVSLLARKRMGQQSFVLNIRSSGIRSSLFKLARDGGVYVVQDMEDQSGSKYQIAFVPCIYTRSYVQNSLRGQGSQSLRNRD